MAKVKELKSDMRSYKEYREKYYPKKSERGGDATSGPERYGIRLAEEALGKYKTLISKQAERA